MGSASAILLDIEGTTTPVAFVTDVLFPYASRHVLEYLKSSWSSPETRHDVEQLLLEHDRDVQAGLQPPELATGGGPEYLESLAHYLSWLIDRDSKTTPLKSIQGRIWREGYASGELKSIVHEDVAPAFERWNKLGRTVAIYSSGSVEAQLLLFSHTNAGDLTRFIHSYFDTNTGPKRETGSYRRIAVALGRDPGEIIFVSDITAELNAARESGMRTLLCVREGNRPQEPNGHRLVTSFENL
ncbi:MAG TPA: acireductone synthase [Blastocatellia bacterium]|nr:acireductone synthase [Blastocatellia bacterium]